MADKDQRNFVADVAMQYGKRLRRFLSAKLRNDHDVPDLAQEVFLRLLRGGRHDSIRSPEAYLFTIAAHVIHQHSVRAAAQPISVDIADVLSELQSLTSDDPTHRVAEVQQIEELEAVLAQLPARVATAFVLHRIGGYSVQEAADELGVSRETAKKYLTRALVHCRNQRAAAAD